MHKISFKGFVTLFSCSLIINSHHTHLTSRRKSHLWGHTVRVTLFLCSYSFCSDNISPLLHLSPQLLWAPCSLSAPIMCSWGVSNGPWLSFPPPFPFHFLITSPLPYLSRAQTRLSLCYFHLPLHPTLPGSSVTPQRQEMGICNTRFSLLLRGFLCTICLSPFPSKRTHLEQVTDHFKHLECGEAITLPSGHLPHPPPPLLPARL